MAVQSFRFRVAPLVMGGYSLDDTTLTYKQGVRTWVIPLAQVKTFAIRERPGFFGITGSQLLFGLDTGDPRKPTKLLRTIYDARSADCRALVETLRARLPAADATGVPWSEGAQRLGVVARPWYEGFLHPRSMIGVMLLGASAIGNATMPATGDSAERLGQGLVGVVVSVIAILLIVSGFRRSRKAAK